MPGDRILYDTPPGVPLGPLAQIADGTAKGFRLAFDQGWFDGFVVRRGDSVFGYVDRCPHAGVRLTRDRETYLSFDRDEIACSWHGATFNIVSGVCTGGPCGGQRLGAWPVTVKDGEMVTA